MAKRQTFQQSSAQRSRRRFSESFKRKKVEEITSKQTSVSEVSRAYQVRRSCIHLWIQKYSPTYRKQERLMVETASDTKQLLALQARIQELERSVGQKQMQLDFAEKMIELAEQHYRIEIKKKFGNKPSSGTGNIGKS